MSRKRGANSDKLSDQQKIFIREYLADPKFNATNAAKAAGYSHPAVAANKLMKNKRVNAEISKQQSLRAARIELDSDRVLEELAYQALRDPIDMVDENGFIEVEDLRQLPERIRRCIDGMEIKQDKDEFGNVVGQTIKIKFTPKMQAIELALKHLGQLKPQSEITNINVENVDNWNQLFQKPDRPDIEETIPNKLKVIEHDPESSRDS